MSALTAAADDVRRAMADEDAPADLETLARKLQEGRWADLLDACRRAIGGGWSMQCGWITADITHLIGFVGPTPWEEISGGLELVESGLYEAIVGATGVDYERPDMAKVAEARAILDRPTRGGRGDG